MNVAMHKRRTLECMENIQDLNQVKDAFPPVDSHSGEVQLCNCKDLIVLHVISTEDEKATSTCVSYKAMDAIKNLMVSQTSALENSRRS